MNRRFLFRSTLASLLIVWGSSAFAGVPTIIFGSGGSDTAASGAGPNDGTTAGATLSGTTNASFSGQTVTLPGGTDLSNVLTNSTHVLYMLTSTGRKFFPIDSTNDGADTLTVVGTLAGTSSSRSWAIGGKRSTFNDTNSRLLFTADMLAGWTIKTEITQSLTSSTISMVAVGDSTTGPVRIEGSGGLQTLTTSANAACLTTGNGGIYQIANLKFTNTNGTKTSAIGITSGSAGNTTCRSCTFGDATNTLLTGFNAASSHNLTLIDNDFTATTSHAVVSTGLANLYAKGNSVHGAAGSGRGFSLTNTTGYVTLEDNLIYANAGAGIFKSSGTTGVTRITGNTIHGNGSDGIDISTTAADSMHLLVINNNLTSNTGYGINGNATTDAMKQLIDFNNYSGNTTNPRNNVTAGTNELAVDPGYAASGSGNFATGSRVWAKGFPLYPAAIGNGATATKSRQAIGAFQPGRGLFSMFGNN